MTPAEVFAEVLAEHAERHDFANQTACCLCGWNGGLVTMWRTHVAERLAARMEDVGGVFLPGFGELPSGVFRLIPRESERPE